MHLLVAQENGFFLLVARCGALPVATRAASLQAPGQPNAPTAGEDTQSTQALVTHTINQKHHTRSFLEGLLDAGIESFMRLGGRCTSARVESHLL